jgi:acetoin utilization protein AcuC
VTPSAALPQGGGRSAVFVGHDIYRRAAYGVLHPLAIARVETVVDLCRALDWLSDARYEVSPRASEDELARFHDRGYIAALRDASKSGRVESAVRERHGIGTMENPIFPGVFERASTSVGGSIRAAERALEGRIAYHPAGGTHHGRPARASGFCFFNDPAFAILTLLDAGVERVAYVDLDAHHCDAVQDAFASDARIRIASIHEADRWPHTGGPDDDAGGRALNLAVPQGFHDRELSVLMDDVVLPFVSRFRPEAVVLTCGADALAGDPLARMALTNVALWDAADVLSRLAPAVVVLGGGGYNPWTLARYWSGLWARLSGQPIPAALPETARAVLAKLACDLVDDEDVRPEWLSTIADARRDAAVRPAIAALRDAAIDRHALRAAA